jgi:hypothetical protein
VGRCRREEEASLVFMQKKAGKLLRQEGSDCIFEAGLPGVNPSNKRPTDAGERALIPQNCQLPMSL